MLGALRKLRKSGRIKKDALHVQDVVFVSLRAPTSFASSRAHLVVRIGLRDRNRSAIKTRRHPSSSHKLKICGSPIVSASKCSPYYSRTQLFCNVEGTDLVSRLTSPPRNYCIPMQSILQQLLALF